MKQVKTLLLKMTVIAAQLENCTDKRMEADLISQYRALSKEQFQLIREFEIREVKPVSYGNLGVKGAGYAHTPHNTQMLNDQLAA